MERETPRHAVAFECGHTAVIAADEYGDGSAWCIDCDDFKVYERCSECQSLDCEHTKVVPAVSININWDCMLEERRRELESVYGGKG